MHELEVKVNHLYDPPHSPQLAEWGIWWISYIRPGSTFIPCESSSCHSSIVLSVVFLFIKANPVFCKLPNT